MSSEPEKPSSEKPAAPPPPPASSAEKASAPPPPPTPPKKVVVVTQAKPSQKKNWLRRAEWVLLSLLLASLLGMAVTQYSAVAGMWYWLIMVPVFAGVYIYLRWPHISKEGGRRREFLRYQAFHWGGTLLAIFFVFVLQGMGDFVSGDSPVVVLLILAMANYFAGIQGGWRFALVGLVLALMALGASFLEQQPWLLPVGGLLLTVAIVTGSRMLRKQNPA